jgi:glycosyltransferase involved in cell wall biosynthesis
MITIFTPCYNQGEFLGRAMDSVLSQTYEDFEYIVVADGCTDDTVSVASKRALVDNRVVVRALSKQDQLSNVLNYGVKKMCGDVFVWVPADDTIMPNLLEEKMKVHDGETVWYSGFNQIDVNDKCLTTIMPEAVAPEDFFNRSYEQCFIGFTGIWIPKKVFGVAGMFPENHKVSEDYYWMLKASKLGVPFRCLRQVLYNKRLHGNRTTDRCAEQIPEEVEKIKAEIDAIRI